MKLLQITDLHLSDRTDTPAAEALRWAIGVANELAPDLVAFTGDMTTYGSAAAAQQMLDAARSLTVPWVFTPGNAERRAEAAALVTLADACAVKECHVAGVHFVLPDTSTGRLASEERAWLSGVSADGPAVLLTHFPLETLDDDSRQWLRSWLRERRIELYLAGHRHFSQKRDVDGCLEVITRGLDPDKAFDGPPGISLFERTSSGWSQQDIDWPYKHDTVPAEIAPSPVGWSIHGDPVATVRETFEAGLHALELRPKEPDYDLATVQTQLQRLRDDRPVYLSWHLPNLKFNEGTGVIDGQPAIAAQIEHGRACGVDSFTVHVPQIQAGRMYDGDKTTPMWAQFMDMYDSLFRDSVADGVRLSIENVHNDPGTPLARGSRKFATEIGEYLSWIDGVRERLPAAEGVIGSHFDVGHARNNGELGNRQPLGDWYARVGSYITGYHIHQVRPHEETGKLTNHRDIGSIHDRTVSYVGFVHAWSTGMLRRSPLFVEVRIAAERRRTEKLIQQLFERPA